MEPEEEEDEEQQKEPEPEQEQEQEQQHNQASSYLHLLGGRTGKYIHRQLLGATCKTPKISMRALETLHRDTVMDGRDGICGSFCRLRTPDRWCRTQHPAPSTRTRLQNRVGARDATARSPPNRGECGPTTETTAALSGGLSLSGQHVSPLRGTRHLDQLQLLLGQAGLQLVPRGRERLKGSGHTGKGSERTRVKLTATELAVPRMVML